MKKLFLVLIFVFNFQIIWAEDVFDTPQKDVISQSIIDALNKNTFFTGLFFSGIKKQN